MAQLVFLIMLTNAQLLELIINQYNSSNDNSSNGFFDRLRGDSPVIKVATEYLRGLTGETPVNTTVLERLVDIFKPPLTEWNISQEPSASLKVLPMIVNAILKSIVSLEDFDPHVSIEDIYTIERSDKYPPAFKKDHNGRYCIALLLELEKIPVSKRLLSESLFLNGVDDSNWFDMATRLIALQKTNQLETLRSILDDFPTHFHYLTRSSQEKNKKKLECQKAIFEAYWEFYEKGLLVPENMACIKILLKPGDFDNKVSILNPVKKFLSLEQAGDLTSEDKQRIGSYKHYRDVENARAHVSILAKLKKVDLLTEKYKAIALTHHSDGFSFDEYACDGLLKLKKANILTEENELAIQQAVTVALFSPDHVANLLIYLNKMNRLIPEAREKYLAPEFLKRLSKSYQIFYLLDRLDKQDLLTGNFDFVLENASLLTKESIDKALKRVPDHLLTQEVWDEIARIVEQNTDEETGLRIEPAERTISAYLQQLLTPARQNQAEAERHEWGAEQSTHTPSVEISVTLSLLRLSEHYHLTKQDVARCIDELRLFSNTIQTERFAHLDTEEWAENKRNAAQRCLLKLIRWTKVNNLEDKHTHFSFNKVLALVWTALKDQASHHQDIALDPMENFIRELYNIQLAYGISATGKELDSCFGGTVNGLVNSLNGIHSDVNLELISRTTIATLTLTHARSIFWERFCEKIGEPDFLEKVNQEIDSTDWQNKGLETWYESCLQATEESVEAECLSRIQRIGVNQTQMQEIMSWIKPWIQDGLITLRTDKYMLDRLKERYGTELPESHAYLSHPVYQQCAQRFPQLKEPLAFILDMEDFSGEPRRDNALVRMREWITDHFNPNTSAHRNLVEQFFKIYRLEQTLLQHKEKLFEAGFLSKKSFSIVARNILDYYSAILDSHGVKIDVNSRPLLQKLTALEQMMQPWLDGDFSQKIENFFAHWFIALKAEDHPAMETLYALLRDKKLEQRVATVVRNFIADTDLAGISVRDITPYQINCLFLYAMLHEPKQWRKSFGPLLDKTLTYIDEKIDSHDANAQQLKQDSYPPSLVRALRYRLQLRQGQLESTQNPGSKLARPDDLLLLPHQVETIDEWVIIAGRLPEAERHTIYRQLESTLEPRFILDLQKNDRNVDAFLTTIPPEKQAFFQEIVQRRDRPEVIPPVLSGMENISEIDVTVNSSSLEIIEEQGRDDGLLREEEIHRDSLLPVASANAPSDNGENVIVPQNKLKDTISKADFEHILNTYKSQSMMGYLSTFWIFSWISPTRSQTMIELKSLLLSSSDEKVTRTQIEAAINRGDNTAHRLGLFKEELGHVKSGTGTDEVIVQLKDELNKGP